ncbi:uncharacterized protein LOC587699 isoform X1 [Strongylocentrotus purpuratus]|uniref:Uncharacterized protein n=1 Tax=Strongylocentrotus purpuratus TaxID=7668 RepID=A0A7M7N7V1_STRPU|nr:uncharacterized protein LOC587699 isoform X1 [Strongylocentrotus purpuratus]
METFTDDENGQGGDFQSGEKLVFDINDLDETPNDTSSKASEDDPGLLKEEEEDADENKEEEKTLKLPESDGDVDASVQIVTSLVEDIDVNSEYMYNNWYTGSGKSEDGRSDEDARSNTVTLEEDGQTLVSDQAPSEHKGSRKNSTQEELELEEKEEMAEKEDNVDGADIPVRVDTVNEIEHVEESLEISSPPDGRSDIASRDRSDNSSVRLVDGLLKSANADVGDHKYKKAVLKYEEALAMATEVNDKFLIQSCACNLGAVLVILGQAERAVEILHQQLENDLERTNGMDTNALADIYYNLGLAYDAKGDSGRAIKCFKWAVVEFDKWKNDKGKADAYNQMAELEAKQGNLDKARKNYSKAAEFYAQVGNGLMKARMLVKEARMLNSLVDTENFHRVVAICEKASAEVLKQNTSKGNTITKEAKLFHDMAVLCKKLGNTDEALRWLEEAWKRCRGTSGTHPSREDVRLQAAVAQSLARMYLHSYDLISAVEIYQEAASLHGLLENYAERGWCFYHMGEAYRQLCDYSSAERSYHVAHQTLTDAGDTDHLWKISDALGDLNVSRNHPDIATMYYREALAKDAPIRSRTKSSTEKIIKKLTKALESQKSNRLSSYETRQKRVPIVVGYDPQGISINQTSQTILDGGAYSSPQSVFKGVRDRYPPVTSTPNGASAAVSKVTPRMRSPSRKKKGKRKDQSLLPVTRGVAGYNSGSDLSLVNGSVASLVREAYIIKMESTGRSRRKGKQSVAPDHSSSEEEDDQEEKSDGSESEEEEEKENQSSDSGFKNMWQRAKDLVSRLQSDSGDSELSSSLEEDEGIQSKESVKYRLDNMYMDPSRLGDSHLYATLNRKGATQKSSNEEPIYETLPNGTTKTGFGASMPTRNPPPPAVPIKTHPSLNKKKKKKGDINRPSTSYDEDDDDSFTSVTEDELEDLDNTTNFERKSNYPTVARMTRGGLEAGLWEIQKLEQEREGIRLSNASSLKSPEPRKPSSKVCSIM